MRVQVTLQNILDYSLDVITGNSRADLLASAEKAEEEGYELFVNIPDVEGGATEEPQERNAFAHYGPDLPEPDGNAHIQEAVDLSRPPIHNPWSETCVKRLEVEPWKTGIYCPICDIQKE